MQVNDDTVVKGFDLDIMKRLGHFIKPYGWIVFVAMLGLFFATAAELITPIILQQTIDENIMTSYTYYSGKTENSAGIENLIGPVLKEDGNIAIGENSWFIPQKNLSVITVNDKHSLNDSGQLGSEEWYLLDRERTINPAFSEINQEQESIIEAHPELFRSLASLSGEEGLAGWTILKSDLSLLSREELSVLRAQDQRGIVDSMWLFLVLIGGTLLFTFLQVYLMAVVGQNVMKDIRLKLLDHLVHQSLSFLQKTPVGSLVSRLTSDVDTINELFTSVAISFVKDFALMIGVIIALFFLNSRLALITLLTLPPVLIATLYFRVKARDVYRRVRMWISKVNAFLSEHISGMGVVQMFGREALSKKEFDINNKGMMKAQLEEMYLFAIFRPFIDLFSSISLAIVLYFGASMYFELRVSLGILFAFINLIQKFYRPVMDLSEKFSIMQSAMAGGERIFDILDNDSTLPDTGSPVSPEDVQGNINFSQVDFAYNPEEPVLRKLSFNIKAGETVAIVGYTGAGKTTIINLLTRFWDIQSGEIRIDGQSIRDFDLSSLRKIILPVQQDVFLFSGTIFENIALGSGISKEKVIAAARTVNADHFINKLPDGYETVIKERGSNLSTGQKQLISFARVIAHDPKIIVLDEATGSIDTETEKLVQDALEILLEGRTSIVIAHRLSTIQHADRILALVNGQLVEEGTHDELLKKRGLYYNLYKLQYQQYSV